MLLMCQWMWDLLGTHLVHPYPFVVCVHIFYSIDRTNGLMCVVMHSIFNSFHVLCTRNSVSLFKCWHFCRLLCALWNITELTHYHHHLPVYSAAWHPFILRNWMAALWFCLDGIAAGYTVFKLCCNECIDTFKYAVLGKSLPVCLLCQMYRCVYRLHCHSIGMDFSFTCLIGLIIWNIFISFLVSLFFFFIVE